MFKLQEWTKLSESSLILFDLMDTLLGVEDHPYWVPIGEALEAAGLCEASEFNSTYPVRRIAWNKSETETSLRARLAHYADVPHDLSDAIERRFLRNYIARSFVIDGVREMLATWRSVCTLGLVSNFFLEGAPRELLDHHGLLENFAFVVDSAEVGYRKPSSKIYEFALAQAGAVERSRVLMIGDNPRADVAGARSAGLNVAHFCPIGNSCDGVTVIKSWDAFRPGM